MNIRQHKLELAADLRLYGLRKAVKRRLDKINDVLYNVGDSAHLYAFEQFNEILDLIDLSEGGDDDGK